jgi:hypothetical protein
MLKESKDPKIIWKCIHSLNPSNHIRSNRLVTVNDLKVDKSIDIAVDLLMWRFKRSCNNSIIFTGGIANCVF